MSTKFKWMISIIGVLLTLWIILNTDILQKDEIRYIKSWYGKNVILPENMTFRLYGKDSVNYDLSKSDYKVLILLDSISCIECQLRLDDWKRFMKDADSLTNAKIDFLFVMSPISRRDLYEVLESENFQIPVCTDGAEFKKINDMILTGIHVFLLDQNNQIICVGNPLTRKRIRDLYLKLVN